METAVVVTHIANSTLAGQTQRFSKTRIVIGRHPESDILFDSLKDLTVSGHHAEITLDEGNVYLRDLESRNGTFVNSERLEGSRTITADDTIRLGDEGPVFQVRTETLALDKTVAGAAAQRKLVGQETLHRVLEGVALRERKKSKKHVVLAGTGVACVALSIAVILWWNQASSSRQLVELKEKVQGAEAAVEKIRNQTQQLIHAKLTRYDQELQKLEGQVSKNASDFGRVMLQIQEHDRLLGQLEQRKDPLSEEQREQLLRETQQRLELLAEEMAKAEQSLRAGSDDNWQTVVENIADSVFLCVAIDSNNSPHIGTAFVLDGSGILVTSAQVIRHLERFPERLAIQNRTGKVFKIAEWHLHPDYNGSIRSPAIGLIRIETDTTLEPIPLANDEQLRKLRVGTHLGTLGYPAELASVYLGGITPRSKEVKAAAATFKDGWIGRITNFSLEPADFEQSRLIQHSASLTDGADGSPLLTLDGVVVGVHLSVETVSYVTKLENGRPIMGRSSNPAEIGYAVRIDVVKNFRQSLGW